MKRTVFVLTCALLSGCAHDVYVSAGADATASEATDLATCKREANHNYFAHQSPAMLLAGIGGAVGGALVGMATHPGPSMSDLIQSCMAGHGWDGTSN